MPPEEANKLIQEYLQELTERKTAEIKSVGEKFLAENLKKDNVKSTESGLQYIVEKRAPVQAPQPQTK